MTGNKPYSDGATDNRWPDDNEEFRESVVKDIEETLDALRNESIYGDRVPDNPSQLNEDASGDWTLDELFGEGNDED